jgi:hypothetical protein
MKESPVAEATGLSDLEHREKDDKRSLRPLSVTERRLTLEVAGAGERCKIRSAGGFREVPEGIFDPLGTGSGREGLAG